MNNKSTNILIFGVLALVLLVILPLVTFIVIFAINSGLEASLETLDTLIANPTELDITALFFNSKPLGLTAPALF